jgi:hypothetical protein
MVGLEIWVCQEGVGVRCRRLNFVWEDTVSLTQIGGQLQCEISCIFSRPKFVESQSESKRQTFGQSQRGIIHHLVSTA